MTWRNLPHLRRPNRKCKLRTNPMQSRRIFESSAPSATILIRLLVGWVFASEGIQKFLFPDALGVGRFTKISIPAPQFFAPFVGVVEIVCGTMLILGLLTPCFGTPSYRHLCRDCNNQDSNALEGRILGDHARGQNRLLHAAGIAVSLNRWIRTVFNRSAALSKKILA
jgi:DoxX-like protein